MIKVCALPLSIFHRSFTLMQGCPGTGKTIFCRRFLATIHHRRVVVMGEGYNGSGCHRYKTFEPRVLESFLRRTKRQQAVENLMKLKLHKALPKSFGLDVAELILSFAYPDVPPEWVFILDGCLPPSNDLVLWKLLLDLFNERHRANYTFFTTAHVYPKRFPVPELEVLDRRTMLYTKSKRGYTPSEMSQYQFIVICNDKEKVLGWV